MWIVKNNQEIQRYWQTPLWFNTYILGIVIVVEYKNISKVSFKYVKENWEFCKTTQTSIITVKKIWVFSYWTGFHAPSIYHIGPHTPLLYSGDIRRGPNLYPFLHPHFRPCVPLLQGSQETGNSERNPLYGITQDDGMDTVSNLGWDTGLDHITPKTEVELPRYTVHSVNLQELEVQ